MWICSKCGEKLEDNFDACWKCRTLKEGYLPADEEKSDKISNKVDSIKGSGASVIPWERRKEIGLLRALWQTVMQILFKPGKFFNNLIDRGDSSGAFSFYFIFSIALIIVEILIVIPLLVVTRNLPFRLFSSFLPFLVVAIIIIPIGIAAGIYIISAIMHLFVLLFRGEGGFNGTFNVMAYSSPVSEVALLISSICSMASIAFFAFIPLPPVFRMIGVFLSLLFLLIGLLWMIVIVVAGYMRIHRLGVIRASCAFLIPILMFGAIQYTINKKEKEKAPQNLEESLERLKQARTRAYEARAKASIMTISVACQAYFTEKGEYPSSLKDLTNTKPPYIESNLAEANSTSAAIEGYYYVYEFLDKEHFTLYAQPVASDIPGGKVFFIDQTGVLRLNGPDGLPAKEEEAEDRIKNEIEYLKSGSAFERSSAASWLGEAGKKEAVEPLIKALRDKEYLVRINAAEALGKIDDNRAVLPLIDSLNDWNPRIQGAAAEALGKIGDSRAVEPLIAVLNKDPELQLYAIESLGMLKDARAVSPLIALLKGRVVGYDVAKALSAIGEPAIDPLIAALKDNDAQVRSGAAQALGLTKSIRAIDPLITTLSDEDSFVVVHNVVEALSVIGEPAVDSLILSLKNEKEKIRMGAARCLGKIKDSRAIEPLLTLLSDAKTEVQCSAIEALGNIADERVKEKLIELAKNENSSIRSSAIKGLGNVKEESVVELLIAALGDNDPLVRASAAESLGNIGNNRAVESLISLLKNGTEGDRVNAIDALGKIKDKRAVDSLILALEKDESWRVRSQAAEALGEIKDERAIPYLISALRDKDQINTSAVGNALRNIIRNITGEDLSFSNDQRDWQKWWEQYKKEK